MSNKKVYVLRDQALGDTIYVQPILAHFLQECHDVTFVGRFAEIFAEQPGLMLISKPNPYQKILIKLARLGLGGRVVDLNDSYERMPELPIIEAYQLRANIELEGKDANPSAFDYGSVVDSRESSRTINFHIQAPSQKLSYRNIHGVDWKELEKRLTDYGYRCVELISKGGGFKPILSDHREHDINTLFSAVSSNDYFIGLDSGPAHVAHLFGKKSFVFFGSVNPELRLNMKRFNGVIFQQSCDRAGCYHLTQGYEGTPCFYETPETTPPCCTFTTEEVWEKLKSELPRIIE